MGKIINGNINPGEKGNPRFTRQAPKGQAGVPQFKPLKGTNGDTHHLFPINRELTTYSGALSATVIDVVSKCHSN